MMGVTSFIFPTLFILFLVWGVSIFRRNANASLTDRFWAASIPLFGFVIFARFVYEMLLAPTQIWDSVHLLPAYLLSDGQPQYYPKETGPILDMMYGPMTAVAYLPVTWLTRDPAVATCLAKWLTIGHFFMPAVILTWIYARRAPQARTMLLGTLVVYGYYVLQSSSLSGSALWNHADAPALGWAGLASVILYERLEKEHWGWLFLSALCAMLSIWTKQVTIPLTVACFVYLLAADGLVVALQYLLCLLGAAALTTGLFAHQHGLSELWYNLVINPAAQPWNKDLVKTEGWAIVELLERVRWLAIALAFYILYEFRQRRSDGSLQRWFDRNRVLLFIGISIFLVPSALAGRMRVGGDLNAISFCTFFLLTGTLAVTFDFATSAKTSEKARFMQTYFKKFLYGYVFISFLIQMPVLTYYYICWPKYLNRLAANPVSMAYDFAKANPGVVYMPWNCLETYLAEGKIYHFEYAVFDREIGLQPPTPEHFQSGLPSNMKYVGYPPNEQARHVMATHFPTFLQEIQIPELPGWTIYSPGPKVESPTAPPDPQRVLRIPAGRLR